MLLKNEAMNGIWEIFEGIRRGMSHTEPSVLLRDSRSEKPLPHSVLRFDIDDGNRLCLKKSTQSLTTSSNQN